MMLVLVALLKTRGMYVSRSIENARSVCLRFAAKRPFGLLWESPACTAGTVEFPTDQRSLRGTFSLAAVSKKAYRPAYSSMEVAWTRTASTQSLYLQLLS
jgi:hypothetical protein